MARPPVFPAEEKVRIVLSILAGEITVAEAARRAKVSEQSVGNWKRQFLEAGKSGLVAGKSGPSTREQQLEAEVTELTLWGSKSRPYILTTGDPPCRAARHGLSCKACSPHCSRRPSRVRSGYSASDSHCCCPWRSKPASGFDGDTHLRFRPSTH